MKVTLNITMLLELCWTIYFVVVVHSKHGSRDITDDVDTNLRLLTSLETTLFVIRVYTNYRTDFAEKEEEKKEKEPMEK